MGLHNLHEANSVAEHLKEDGWMYVGQYRIRSMFVLTLVFASAFAFARLKDPTAQAITEIVQTLALIFAPCLAFGISCWFFPKYRILVGCIVLACFASGLCWYFLHHEQSTFGSVSATGILALVLWTPQALGYYFLRSQVFYEYPSRQASPTSLPQTMPIAPTNPVASEVRESPR